MTIQLIPKNYKLKIVNYQVFPLSDIPNITHLIKRAEQEKHRAEQEKQRADLAEAKLQELRDRMKQMGIEL